MKKSNNFFLIQKNYSNPLMRFFTNSMKNRKIKAKHLETGVSEASAPNDKE